MANLKKALESQLVRLMMHILKFFIQPLKRTRSWIISIYNARDKIDEILRKQPSLKNRIKLIWNDVFRKAKKKAEEETEQDCDIEELDWDTTFNQKFDLDDEDDE